MRGNNPQQGFAYFGIAVHDGKIGILDIGSNSVRLVVYDGMKRSPMPVFNEKVLCALGRDLARTGKLNPEGVTAAKDAIARYLTMARIMDVVELSIIATAAIRDADDGKAFVKAIESDHNVKVQVISGKQEAKLAAKGVQASLHQPSGLVGDLGGGSLELVHVEGDRLSESTTLPLGGLRLMEASGYDVKQAAKVVQSHLAKLPWLKTEQLAGFYAVGGSFRMLAHVHLLKKKYPLEVLHAYEVKSENFIPFLRKIAKKDTETIAALPGASEKRADQLPYAATAMAELLEWADIPKVVFSAAGIREGFLFDQLSPYLKQEDGLIACCVDLASQHGRLESYPRDVYHWMEPLFTQSAPSWERVRFACCLLSEFAWRIHPQYRAEWQFTRIIQSSFTSLNHQERVALALALYQRHKLKTKLADEAPLKLLSEADQAWCQLVGQALGLGFSLSGGMSGVLAKVPLHVEGDHITVKAADEVQGLLSESLSSRLDGLGESFSAWCNLAK